VAGKTIDEHVLSQISAEELARYRSVVLQTLAANLRKKKLIVSGHTLNSLAAEVYEEADALAGLAVEFEPSGRYQEMGRLDFNGLPPLDPILAWVKKKGMAKFSHVPGYERTMPADRERGMVRIAEGIRRGIAKRNTKKAVKWWSRDFYKGINGVVSRIVTRYAEVAGTFLDVLES
jgi:hypothetical protein